MADKGLYVCVETVLDQYFREVAGHHLGFFGSGEILGNVGVPQFDP
jgi:hypothetical protein